MLDLFWLATLSAWAGGIAGYRQYLRDQRRRMDEEEMQRVTSWATVRTVVALPDISAAQAEAVHAYGRMLQAARDEMERQCLLGASGGSTDGPLQVELVRTFTPPTPEQIEANYERERNAKEKSRALLESWLTAEQLASLQQRRGFEVIGGQSGDRYIIVIRQSYNVWRVRDHVCFCVAPLGVPVYDAMLAQKIMLETDELVFLSKANRRSYDEYNEVQVRSLMGQELAGFDIDTGNAATGLPHAPAFREYYQGLRDGVATWDNYHEDDLRLTAVR